MKRRYVFLLILLSALMTLAIGFPLRTLETQYPQMHQFGTIEGHPTAGQLSPKPPFAPHVETATWQFNPSTLLKAQLGTHLTLSGPKLNFTADAAIGLSQTIEFDHLDGRAQASVILDILNNNMVSLDGLIVAQDIGGKIKDQWLLDPKGQLVWRNAKIGGFVDIDLGQVVAEFSNDESTNIVEVANTGGMLAISGLIQVKPDRSYSLDATIKPTTNAQDFDFILSQVGQRNADGSYRVVREGNLGAL
ncbi:MAG: type II secretion system protein N [Gammaproteobacteria bacterium]|nr:type II secretion system protein N [Gammaproteobacteria bacterium]